MEKKIFILIAIILLNAGFYGCKKKAETLKPIKVEEMELSEMQKKLGKYVNFKLTSDLSVLTSKEKQMLPLLLEAAIIMDDLYWEQALGDKTNFFKYLDCNNNEDVRKFAIINLDLGIDFITMLVLLISVVTNRQGQIFILLT